MNLTNFRLETDADGIALITWDMPGRSMNVLNAEVIAEIGEFVDHVASDAAIKGAVITSGKDGFSGGADLTMLQGMGAEYARVAKAEGEEAAMRVFYEGSRKLILDLSQAGDLRQAVRRRDQRRLHGRRLRAGARLPLPHRRRQRQGARRPAGDQGRPVPRRRRHAARRAADADARRVADAVQGRPDHARPRPRRWASCTRSRRSARSSQRAKDWVKANPNAKAPWDDPNFKLPSGKVFSPTGMMIWPAANAIYRRETYDNYPAAQGDPLQRVRGPATADGPRARGREPLFREDPALEGGGGDDPLAVPVDGRTQQGRAPPGRAFPRRS